MNKLYDMIEPDFTFEDARGKLAQLVHTGYEQVNVLVTKQGVTRGGHYHKCSKEAFYVVSGCVDVTFTKGDSEEKRCFVPGEFFLIYPYTVHSMYFPEDCVLVAMYDQCVEKTNGEKDIYASEQ